MIFHRPTSFDNIKACAKRADRFAMPGSIVSSHPLAPAWANCKMMVDAEDDGKPYLTNTGNGRAEEAVHDAVLSLRCLDWFATKVDEHSKTNMVSGDASLAAMLYEWKQRLILDPLKL